MGRVARRKRQAEPDEWLIAIYARKSRIAKDKDIEGIDSQIYHCEERAKRLLEDKPGRIVVIFREEGKSASKEEVDRDEYNKLVAMIENGEVNLVLVREQSRISRRFEQLMLFLMVAKAQNAIGMESNGKRISLKRNDKWMTVIQGLKDEDETDLMADRVRDKMYFKATQGEPPHGRFRRFGYSKDYSEIIEPEAEILRDMVEWVLGGMDGYSIARDLNKAERLHYTNTPWTSDKVKAQVTAPEIYGLRSFNGEILGDGNWTAIIKDKNKYYKVLEKFEGNKPFSTDTSTKYLLVGVLKCGKCGHSMRAQGYKDMAKSRYACESAKGGCGKIAVRMLAVDKLVTDLTYKALQVIPAATPDKPDDSAIEAEIERLEKKITDAVEAHNNDDITLADLVAIRKDNTAKIKAERKKLHRPVPLVDNAQAFKDASTDKKRSVIASMWTLGIRPASRKGEPFTKARLIYDPK